MRLCTNFYYSIGPDIPINVQFPELKQKIIFKALTSLGQELVPIINTMYVLTWYIETSTIILISISVFDFCLCVLVRSLETPQRS